jgi:DNA-binding XRE family transcriptional regulator
LPFCHLQIKALRCPYPDLWKCKQIVPDKPTTLGEHIRRRRLELHMLQSQVASLLRANRISVQNWERGVYEPAPKFLHGIAQFLGYDPNAKA